VNIQQNKHKIVFRSDEPKWSESTGCEHDVSIT